MRRLSLRDGSLRLRFGLLFFLLRRSSCFKQILYTLCRSASHAFFFRSKLFPIYYFVCNL